MFRQSTAILGLSLGFALAALPSEGGFLRGADSSRSLPNLGGRFVVVAVEDDNPPFSSLTSGKLNPVGWDYDTFRAIGRRLNFRPVFKEIGGGGIIQGVATGQFDVAGDGIAVTPERAIAVDFSTSYAQVHQRLLVRKSEKRFEMLKWFVRYPGVRIGAERGSANYKRAVELVGTSRVVAYSTFADLVPALLSGELDAVIIDDVGTQVYLGANAKLLRLLFGVLPGQDLALIFTQGSSLRDSVNQALASMREDGTLKRLNSRWLSSSLHN